MIIDRLQLLVALARVVGNVLAHKASWTALLCVTWGRRVWQKAWRRLATARIEEARMQMKKRRESLGLRQRTVERNKK